MGDEQQPWLAGLNPGQREAVTHTEGPLLIVAGAGTGKTKTLACRVAHLIASGTAPGRILLLTFTRRAAQEMLKRAERLVGGTAGSQVWGGTFHATSNRLLRLHGRAVGLPADFTVMDEADAADLMNLIRSEIGFQAGDRRFPRKETLLAIYSHSVNAQRPLRETLDEHFPYHRDDFEDIRRIFEGYVARKKEQQVLDFDDLLLFWSALCDSSAGPRLARQFDHILVDEYQDTNAIQAEVLRGMRRGGGNITAVGDDAQSIYSFRAATVRNILDFPAHFPGARIVTLEQNYRSTQPILRAANAVMESARERYTKQLWSERESQTKPALVTCMDEAEQTECACNNILEHREKGVPLRRQAVLFRASHHSAMLELELVRRNIPYHKYGGLKFLEAAHIKDVIALLRLVENPYDEISWFRVLIWFDRVGHGTARRIIAELGVRRGDGGSRIAAPSDALEGEPPRIAAATPLGRLLTGLPDSVPDAAAERFNTMREAFAFCVARALPALPADSSGPGAVRPTMEQASEPAPATENTGDSESDGIRTRRAGKRRRGGGEPSVVEQLECLFRFYEPICKTLYDNAAARLRDFDSLLSIAARYRSRSSFITELTLDPPQSTSDLAGPPYVDEDYLVLSTIHSAKGCEWDVVHVLHAADGMIPSDMATGSADEIDEERRLFYVALTRARDMLYVYFPLRYYHRRFGLSAEHGFAQVTRFLEPPVRAYFCEKYGTLDADDNSASTKALPSPNNPYARVSRLWE